MGLSGMDFYDIRELEDCYNIDTNFLINSMEKQLKKASACSMSIIQGNNLLTDFVLMILILLKKN